MKLTLKCNHEQPKDTKNRAHNHRLVLLQHFAGDKKVQIRNSPAVCRFRSDPAGLWWCGTVPAIQGNRMIRLVTWLCLGESVTPGAAARTETTGSDFTRKNQLLPILIQGNGFQTAAIYPLKYRKPRLMTTISATPRAKLFKTSRFPCFNISPRIA